MPRVWRQGDVLPLDAAREIDSTVDGETRFIVCSHSCDLQVMQGELLMVATGRCVAEENGNFVGAKSIKTLQLSSVSGRLVHYAIESLRSINVAILDRCDPWEAEAHSAEDRTALSAWLAQRFDRLALPDAVVKALQDSGIEKTIDTGLKTVGTAICDVRVLLDEAAAVPSISFLLIYDAGLPDAKATTERIAKAIRDRAELKANLLEGKLSVETAIIVADTAFTYANFRKTRPYRVDHVSLRATPPTERPTR